MNVDFLLAATFGFGVAGFMGHVVQSAGGSLSLRLTPRKVTFRVAMTGSHKDSKKKLAWHFQSLSSPRLDRILFELPEIIDLLTVCLRAGDGVYRSFATVIPKCDGELSREISKALKAVEFGASFGVELKQVSKALPHPQVSEFVSKVSLALERGTPLAQMLSEQGLSVREEIKNRLLRQAGKNETRMLVPLVFLILPVTVLFAIYPSLELLNFGFI